MQGTFCNVPSACDGVALADGSCCLYELSRSGDCCEVVDKDMECCDSGVLDAVGVCQGTAVSVDYNGQACTVRRHLALSRCHLSLVRKSFGHASMHALLEKACCPLA